MGQRFDALDGMRGICAFIILIYHCDGALNTGHLLTQGWLCVDAFFVLSGFVIAHRYEADLGRQGGLRRFVQGRFGRLVPTMELGYLFSACCLLPLYLHGQGLWREVPPAAFAAAAVFGALWIPMSLAPMTSYPAFAGADYPIDTPLWSLFSEAVANTLYGLFLHALGTRILIGIILALWFVLLGMSLHSYSGWQTMELVPAAARGLSGFLAGVVLQRWFKAGRLNALPSVNPVLVFSGWFFVCCIPYRQSLPLFAGLIAILGVPLAVMLLVRTKHTTPKLFRWLGYVSYPLYVSHFGIVWIGLTFLPHHVERENILWAVPMCAVALGVAWVIAALTEKRRKPAPMLAEVRV